MSAFAAVKFTSDQQQIPKKCGGCRKRFEPDEDTFYVHSVDQSVPGRHVCLDCRKYYMGKPTTVHYNKTASSDHADTRREIRQQIAIARRGEDHAQSVVHMRHPASQPGPSRAFAVPMPNVATPADCSQFPFPVFPQGFVSLPPPEDAKEAHERWMMHKNHLQSAAKACGRTIDVILVNFRMKSLLPLRKTPAPIADICETVSGLPVNIGAHALKLIGVTALASKYMKWTRGLKLTMDDVELRDDAWELLTPKEPSDVDIISSKFYKKAPARGNNANTSKKVFMQNRVEYLVIALPYDKYEIALAHSNGEFENETSPRPVLTIKVPKRQSKAATKPATKGKGKRKATALTEVLEGSISEAIGLRSRIGANTQEEPSAVVSKIPVRENLFLPESEEPASEPESETDQLKRALLAQKKSNRASIKGLGLYTLKVIKCTIYPAEFPSFDDLIGNPGMPVFKTEGIFTAILTFDKNQRVSGGCKYAYFGETDTPIFAGAATNKICLKEAYYIAKDTGNRCVYDPATQGGMLTTEANCSRWANALTTVSYKFIEDENKKRGEPPFPIPELRYVKVALAVAQDTTRVTYLLEEFIDESDGGFSKYINNTAAVPLSTTDPARKETGDFLAFTQHVQYNVTKKLAFVSDQQGGLTLLSDPQIITSPSIGRQKLFSDGNITSSFSNFVSEHKCNKYCNYYGLKKFKPPLQPWERMQRNAEQIRKELEEEKLQSIAESGEITDGGSTRKRLRKC